MGLVVAAGDRPTTSSALTVTASFALRQSQRLSYVLIREAHLDVIFALYPANSAALCPRYRRRLGTCGRGNIPYRGDDDQYHVSIGEA